jgi:hypothetical protein
MSVRRTSSARRYSSASRPRTARAGTRASPRTAARDAARTMACVARSVGGVSAHADTGGAILSSVGRLPDPGSRRSCRHGPGPPAAEHARGVSPILSVTGHPPFSVRRSTAASNPDLGLSGSGSKEYVWDVRDNSAKGESVKRSLASAFVGAIVLTTMLVAPTAQAAGTASRSTSCSMSIFMKFKPAMVHGINPRTFLKLSPRLGSCTGGTVSSASGYGGSIGDLRCNSGRSSRRPPPRRC